MIVYKKIALISHWNDFSLFPFGEMWFKKNYKQMQKIKFWQIWERTLHEITEYAFDVTYTSTIILNRI